MKPTSAETGRQERCKKLQEESFRQADTKEEFTIKYLVLSCMGRKMTAVAVLMVIKNMVSAL